MQRSIGLIVGVTGAIHGKPDSGRMYIKECS